MTKQVLDREQMQHLKELGVDTSKASMALVYENSHGDVVDWSIAIDGIHETHIGQFNDYLMIRYGVFTLQDILDLLPQCIIGGLLCVEKRNLNGSTIWSIAYKDTFGQYSKSIFEETLIDAAYEMLCWCIENGYIE